MSEPSDIPRSPEEWGAWAAAALAVWVGIRKGLDKLGLTGASSTEKMIAAFREENREHREQLIEGITRAFHEEFASVRNDLREINEKTRERLAPILESTDRRLTVMEKMIEILEERTR